MKPISKILIFLIVCSYFDIQNSFADTKTSLSLKPHNEVFHINKFIDKVLIPAKSICKKIDKIQMKEITRGEFEEISDFNKRYKEFEEAKSKDVETLTQQKESFWGIYRVSFRDSVNTSKYNIDQKEFSYINIPFPAKEEVNILHESCGNNYNYCSSKAYTLIMQGNSSKKAIFRPKRKTELFAQLYPLLQLQNFHVTPEIAKKRKGQVSV